MKPERSTARSPFEPGPTAPRRSRHRPRRSAPTRACRATQRRPHRGRRTERARLCGVLRRRARNWGCRDPNHSREDADGKVRGGTPRSSRERTSSQARASFFLDRSHSRPGSGALPSGPPCFARRPTASDLWRLSRLCGRTRASCTMAVLIRARGSASKPGRLLPAILHDECVPNLLITVPAAFSTVGDLYTPGFLAAAAACSIGGPCPDFEPWAAAGARRHDCFARDGCLHCGSDGTTRNARAGVRVRGRRPLEHTQPRGA